MLWYREQHAGGWCRQLKHLCLIILVVTVAACAPLVPRPDVVIGTGNPGGTYYPLGNSICRVFNLDIPNREGAAPTSRRPARWPPSTHCGMAVLMSASFNRTFLSML